MAVAAELVAVAQHKKLADGRARPHHEHQYQPVLRVAPGKAVVVAQHGKQHRQREVGVVHAALLAALAMDRVHRLAGLDACDHFSLAGDNPDQHIGAHRRGHHGAHQQKGRAPGKPVAGQVRCGAHQQRDQCANDGIAMPAAAQQPANTVVEQPEHHQE